MALTADGTSICPGCAHPVTLNATRCPACQRMFHEICLKQGCTCSKKGAGTGNPDALVVMNFGLGLIALGAAAWLRGSRATSSPLFMPAAALGGIGFLAACARKIDDPAEAKTGHSSAQLLFLPAIATAVVAAKGAEFGGFVMFFAIGCLGLLVGLIGLLQDGDRSVSALSVMAAALLFMVNAVTLKADFAKRAAVQAKLVATGKASMTAPLGAVPVGNTPAEKPFTVSGVMNVGGVRKAMTPKGAFGAGDAIPDIGRVKSVTDDEVVVEQSGGVTRYPVPR